VTTQRAQRVQTMPPPQLHELVRYHMLEPEEVLIAGAQGFGGVTGHASGHAMLFEERAHLESLVTTESIVQWVCRF
jgi:hypothetical protein